MTWLSSNGGKVRAKDTVAGLSQLGAKGKYPANVERDTHRMLRRTGQWLGAAIDHVPVRMVNGEPIYLGGKLGETASHTPSPVLPCFVETREGNLPAMPFRQIFWRWCEKLLEPHWGHMWLVGWSPGSSVAEQVEAYICGGLRRRGRCLQKQRMRPGVRGGLDFRVSLPQRIDVEIFHNRMLVWTSAVWTHLQRLHGTCRQQLWNARRSKKEVAVEWR